MLSNGCICAILFSTRDVEARREWAERHLNYAWFGSENLRYPHVKDDWKVVWIDIDEKWFYMRTQKKRKLRSGLEESKTAVKSKRHIDKVMVLCATDGRKETSTVLLEYIGALK